MTKRQFRVLIGINYPPGDKRAEPGDVVDDIPEIDHRWLIAQGAIEPVETSRAKADAEPPPRKED